MLLAQGGVNQRKGESKGNEGNEYDHKDQRDDPVILVHKLIFSSVSEFKGHLTPSAGNYKRLNVNND